MKNKKCLTYLSVLYFLGIIIVPTITANITCTISDKQQHLESVDTSSGSSHLIVDAFIVGIINGSRGDRFGIVFVDAIFVYTTEFHKFCHGEIEITGFRGFLSSLFVCGFYNDGW